MHRPVRVHPRGVLSRAFERLRGRSQLLIRASADLPLVVASYPRGSQSFAAALRTALTSTYRALSAAARNSYAEVLERTPTLVVAELRARNPCTCLGHHHPPGAESRLARRLREDTGGKVGEVDLAVEAIRHWEPLPLADLAVAAQAAGRRDAARAFAEHRFHAGLLAVFLHELEHLAFPRRAERQIRQRSNAFYARALQEFVSQEFGVEFGMDRFDAPVERHSGGTKM